MGRVAFSTQIEGFDRRVRALLEAFSAPDIERSAVLNAAVEELSTSLEELKVAEEELAAQNLELESAHASVQAERRRYREFFMSAQEGYLVTDHKGIIVEGNPAAGQLLGASLANLPGKPLATFVVANERAAVPAVAPPHRGPRAERRHPRGGARQHPGTRALVPLRVHVLADR